MKDPEFHTIEISDPRFESAGLRHVTVKSKSLAGRADLSLFVPQGVPTSAKDLPLVILLHGVYGSHWAWSQKAGAHQTTQALIDRGTIPPMVLAMPSDGLWGDGSGYLSHSDRDFEHWIVDEVPAAAILAAPVLSKKSPRFIAGLSMGGYGALRLGARYSDRFRSIAGHSSITRFEQLQQFVEEPSTAYPIQPGDHSVVEAMIRASGPLPAIRFDCGLDDPLLEANRELSRALTDAGIEHVYEEFPGGHDWRYWERHLADTLRFFADALPPRDRQAT